MGIEAHERKGNTMEAQHAGTITEDEGMEGNELAHVIIDHWHAGAGAMLYADEVAHACKTVGVSSDYVMAVVGAVNAMRGHDMDKDVLGHAFVPQENIEAVTALLDQVAALCVSM